MTSLVEKNQARAEFRKLLSGLEIAQLLAREDKHEIAAKAVGEYFAVYTPAAPKPEPSAPAAPLRCRARLTSSQPVDLPRVPPSSFVRAAAPEISFITRDPRYPTEVVIRLEADAIAVRAVTWLHGVWHEKTVDTCVATWESTFSAKAATHLSAVFTQILRFVSASVEKAYFREQAEYARQRSAEKGMVPLEGTRAQCDWAEKIREELVKDRELPADVREGVPLVRSAKEIIELHLLLKARRSAGQPTGKPQLRRFLKCLKEAKLAASQGQ